MYIPAIAGYVPDEIVGCLTAFLDACYIVRRQQINSEALDALDAALHNFRQLREVFQTPGVPHNSAMYGLCICKSPCAMLPMHS